MTVTAEHFELEGAKGRPIRGDARVVRGAVASIVMAHGFKGFGRWGFFPWLADRFAGAGFTTISFDFSGCGVGVDREQFTEFDAFAENTFSGELHDLRLVIAHAADRFGAGGRRGLFGFSRGGGVSILQAASDETLSALVTWSAISTINRYSPAALEEWRRRGYAEVVNARTGQTMRVGLDTLHEIEQLSSGPLDIQDAAARVRAAWLIVHGEADETVPVHEGRQLHTASEHRAELMIVPGATHTYGATHPMGEPTPQLLAAAERTVRFFRANLEP